MYSPWMYTQGDPPGTTHRSHKRGCLLLHYRQLTFTVGEVIGTQNTHITTQSGHAGPAATLPRGRLTSRMQGTVGGAVAGCGVKSVGTR